MTFPWLSVLWLLPLVGAVVIILLPAGGRQFAKWLGVAVSVAVLVLSIALALQFKALHRARIVLRPRGTASGFMRKRR